MLEELCESWTDPIRLHDPLALVALMGEPIVSTRRVCLVVDGDGRVSEDPDGRECEVVDDVDVDAALADRARPHRTGADPASVAFRRHEAPVAQRDRAVDF